MNVEQAKQLSLPDLLAVLGHRAVKETKGGRELWYRSPFREEKAPSFHTSYLNGKWIWNDFGDSGGTIIDFAIRYLQQQGKPADTSAALAFLQDQLQPGLFAPKINRDRSTSSFHPQPPREAGENFLDVTEPTERSLEFIEATPLHRQAILSYLTEERHIPAPLARKYLREVRYRNNANGKEYFAFGMANASGGFEIRVASSQYSFKSALIARDITVIAGNGSPYSVSVFEGMTDFLSLLALQEREALPEDAIIMHSLSSYGKAAKAIHAKPYDIIKTYLDNNKPGQEATAKFHAEFPGKVYPQSDSFAPHTDLNDALRDQATKPKTPPPTGKPPSSKTSKGRG